MRDILKNPDLAFSKIAFPRETIRSFWRFDHIRIFENRALARDIFEIPSIYLNVNRSKLRSRAEHSEKFDEIYLPKSRTCSRVLGGAFWYRIRRIHRSNFDHLKTDFYTNSIPNCFAQGRPLLA